MNEHSLRSSECERMSELIEWREQELRSSGFKELRSSELNENDLIS